jgi:hypothetical protein
MAYALIGTTKAAHDDEVWACKWATSASTSADVIVTGWSGLAHALYVSGPFFRQINQSINQSTKQPTNQPINQSTNQSTN